jgi:hypothetical protein
MKRSHYTFLLALAATMIVGALVSTSFAQEQTAHLGYAYPGGIPRGGSLEVTIGGQYLEDTTEILISGEGVEATFVSHFRPLNGQEFNRARRSLQECQAEVRERVQSGATQEEKRLLLEEIAEEKEFDIEILDKYVAQNARDRDPKIQLNPAIEELVVLEITCGPNAVHGMRELRLLTNKGLSNPIAFHVGAFPEHYENEPNGDKPDEVELPSPFIINGQIMPGDVDRFQFNASAGQRLVIETSARELIPYLADAVPGWFQAIVAIYDSQGAEVAYVDDYQFHPDPVLFYTVPRNGEYTVEIRDSIYRGREDFVYRITIGQTPFVTSIFPLGGNLNQPTPVRVGGGNLNSYSMTIAPEQKRWGIFPLIVQRNEMTSAEAMFAVDTLPEIFETEPNSIPAQSQEISPGLIINGLISQPGDRDVFRFTGKEGDEIIAEVLARRLHSPLDSMLMLTTASGELIASNDDFENRAEGMLTHHADSYLSVTLPSDGIYLLTLSDAQYNGGGVYAYRLRITPPRPEFELRVIPSSLSIRAAGGTPITVFALRKDGYTGPVNVRLKNPPPGYELYGGVIQEGAESARMTLNLAGNASLDSTSIQLEGYIAGDSTILPRPVVPADDVMQAFLWRHLCPAQVLAVAPTGSTRAWSIKISEDALEPAQMEVNGLAVSFKFKPTGGQFQLQDGEFSKNAIGILNRIQASLDDPPPGIEFVGKQVTSDSLVIRVRATEEAEAGMRGNLVINASLKAATGNSRTPLGAFPAVPFEVVAP